MTDAEKIQVLHDLIETRADMAEHTIATASKFKSACRDLSSYNDMYITKITAANAVSGFCYELLEIMHALSLEE